MIFLYPLGLLGLIGVPILIIIYIIKNKYTEQTVASTYIWTLSERFLKRKNPINRLYNLISLILQILAVICISVAIASPVFLLPGQANDYCFVLDGSDSMSISADGTTRFERGKQKIEEIIAESKNGSVYTLICAGDTAVVVYENITDRDRAIELLDDAEPISGTADVTAALGEAQEYFNQTPSLKVYFLTDKDYRSDDNVQVVNLAQEERNVALLTAESEFVGEQLQIKGKIIAYGADQMATVSVFVNGATAAAGQATISVKGISEKISLDDEDLSERLLEKATDFVVTCENVGDYQSVRVAIDETDALAKDNEIVLYNMKHDTSFSTLIVSETPFFMQTMLKSLGHKQVETMTPDDYKKSADSLNYGLYIFDLYTPERMPTDGAVWFFAPTSIENSGFEYQSDSGDHAKRVLTYHSSSSTAVRKMLEGVNTNEELFISKYAKYGWSRDFTTILSCEGNPVLFVGSNSYGNREAVCAFSLHDADLALTYNFFPLINNLLNYTFPPVIEKADYVCGDTAQINVLANCSYIRVTTPDGTEEYLNVDTAVSEYRLKQVGLYTVTLKIGENSANATERTVYLFAQTPYSESVSLAEDATFSLIGEPSDDARDGLFEDLTLLFLILAAFFVADWMVYCYEQYQLR